MLRGMIAPSAQSCREEDRCDVQLVLTRSRDGLCPAVSELCGLPHVQERPPASAPGGHRGWLRPPSLEQPQASFAPRVVGLSCPHVGQSALGMASFEKQS